MKLATWKITAAAIALLLTAGTLRAQSPESLPEPGRPQTNKYWRQNGPSAPNANYWSEYGQEARSADPNQNDLGGQMNAASITIEGGEFVETDPAMMDDDGPAFPYSSGNWWRNGNWYAASDFVIWHRTKPFGQVIGFDGSFPPQSILIPVPELNKQGSTFGLAPGNRTTLGYMLMRDIDNRDHSIEATYLGFGDFTTHTGLISKLPRRLFTPLDLSVPGFNGADTFDTNETSQLQSIEVNYRIRNRPGRDRMVMGSDGFWSRQLVPGPTQSLNIGLRAISIDERWQWLSARNGVSPDAFSGNMQINTRNKLLGLQVGGDLIGVHDAFYWGVRGNAGMYCDFDKGIYNLNAVDDTGTRRQYSVNTNASAAFFGELSFMAGLNLTNHLALRASIDMALAGGLALAPDQVSFDKYLAANNPSLNEGGQIFYSGLSVGLEGYW